MAGTVTFLKAWEIVALKEIAKTGQKLTAE